MGQSHFRFTISALAPVFDGHRHRSARNRVIRLDELSRLTRDLPGVFSKVGLST